MELPALDTNDLGRLEQPTVDFNIFWRDTFGMLSFHLLCFLTLTIGKKACTYKVHRLLHLARQYVTVGLVDTHGFFPFDRGNLLATRSIHRRDRAYSYISSFRAHMTKSLWRTLPVLQDCAHQL